LWTVLRGGLAARPLLAKHNGAAIIEPDDVERVLTDINADYGSRSLCGRSHGVLLGLGTPGQLSAGGAGAQPDHPISCSERPLKIKDFLASFCLFYRSRVAI
jgi:hypothetical protein